MNIKKNTKKNIRNNLKKYRIWKNITQNELAIKLKIGRETLIRIENHNKYPKYQMRVKICKFFNVSQDQMFYLD